MLRLAKTSRLSDAIGGAGFLWQDWPRGAGSGNKTQGTEQANGGTFGFGITAHIRVCNEIVRLLLFDGNISLEITLVQDLTPRVVATWKRRGPTRKLNSTEESIYIHCQSQFPFDFLLLFYSRAWFL